ncbi:retinol dehydrogenase 12-like isoform X1 [Tachyglossus aculeatus]|uniref:retinol dehydrogenase 12-like isoform X1 n=1 Tax=Tachyglossus aculeatus TaxID=9261 RepID=UPI0018F67213|nr:retinol dehydrogenase 12-like isoform X1 [Tachyglossus aculeatus]
MERWRELRPAGRGAIWGLLLAPFRLWLYLWRGRNVLQAVWILLHHCWAHRPSSWDPQSCPTTLTGMTAVVTGATSGIGKQVALELAQRGARVVLACRDLTRGQEALDEIRAATGCGPRRLLLREVDLGSLASVRAFAARLLAELPQIHLLVNNAGVYGLVAKSPDGLNLTIATNYLGPFLLTNLLLEGLRRADRARIVNVSSFREKFGFIDEGYLSGGGVRLTPQQSYDCSKLLLLAFTSQLARHLQGTGVTVNAADPGLVVTNITRNLGRTWKLLLYLLRPFFKSPAQGARSILYCCLAQEVEGVTGKFFGNNCTLQQPAAPARDPVLARSVWTASCRLTGLSPPAVSMGQPPRLPWPTLGTPQRSRVRKKSTLPGIAHPGTRGGNK